jgi:adenylate cyclase
MASTRRLVAILAADVAGYSRLMGLDEEGTHQRVRAHLAELVEPKIEERRGRTVKNTGDGLLAEFPSVVDAVRCAVEVQRGMIDREHDVPEECRIRFRIGVNLEDVIVEEHDIFGDGVNVAARLETLADPASQFEAVDKSRLRAKFLSGYQHARSELLEKLDFDLCEAGASSSIQKLNRLSR